VETATASTPENAAFHGTAPASFPAQKAAASLAAAGACGVRLAQKWTRGMERALGRGRRTDNGDEVGAVVLQDVSGRRRTVGRRAIDMFFFPFLCFVLIFLFLFKKTAQGLGQQGFFCLEPILLLKNH